MPEVALEVETTNQAPPHRVGAGPITDRADPPAASPPRMPSGPILSPRDHRRNFILGVINGALFRIGDTFTDAQLVLTWFLAQLGASNVLIGLVSPMKFGGSFLLQLLVAGYIERRPYKLPLYRFISVFRSIILLVFALMVALTPANSPWLIGAFFAMLGLFSLGAGLSTVPFMDIVAKVVPPQRRGAFFGQRMFWGGILALGGSAVVGFLLSEPRGLAFPLNVSLLFALAMVFVSLQALSWSFVKEPPGTVSSTASQGSLLTQLRRGLELLRTDELYRRYALVRMAFIIAGWADPFYAVYAQRKLGAPSAMLGLYLGARTVAGIVSNLLWGRISDRMGNRRLMIIAAALGILTPMLVLAMSALHAVVPSAAVWPSYAYAAVFLVAGTFSSASGIVISSYVLDIAPDEERPLYLAFNNTLFGLAQFSSMVGGLIVEWAGFTTLLMISVIFYSLALLLSFRVVEPRSIVRRASSMARAYLPPTR